jgi:hypothetical protein
MFLRRVKLYNLHYEAEPKTTKMGLGLVKTWNFINIRVLKNQNYISLSKNNSEKYSGQDNDSQPNDGQNLFAKSNLQTDPDTGRP